MLRTTDDRGRTIRPQIRLGLLGVGFLLLGSGCGLDHYEHQMESEQKRVKYLDDENRNLEGSALKLPEKKGEDKEAVQSNDFFFRPPKGISTTPEPQALGLLYRYPSTNPNDNIQDLLVAVVKTKESTDKFRQDILQNLRGLGLSAAGPVKSRDAGVPTGHPVHYDFYELQGGPNQPGGSVHFYREYIEGEGAYQVAVAFRGTPSSPAGIPNDSPLIDLTLGSLRLDGAAQAQYKRFRPVPQSGPRNRR
jgi:hypothetical protein